jgi:hypothetical protein
MVQWIDLLDSLMRAELALYLDNNKTRTSATDWKFKWNPSARLQRQVMAHGGLLGTVGSHLCWADWYRHSTTPQLGCTAVHRMSASSLSASLIQALHLRRALCNAIRTRSRPVGPCSQQSATDQPLAGCNLDTQRTTRQSAVASSA